MFHYLRLINRMSGTNFGLSSGRVRDLRARCSDLHIRPMGAAWRSQMAVALGVLIAACGTNTATNRGGKITTTVQTTATRGAETKTCTKADLGFGSGLIGPPQPPAAKRLAKPGVYWFGRIHLDPPSSSDVPKVSARDAWFGPQLSFNLYASATYDLVLAYWNLDDDVQAAGPSRPVTHKRVLAWVVIGRHVPIEASDVSPSLRKPGVPCYFGTSIDAVDATTGDFIAGASDYSG